jgi:phosphinothricin acetyltransferase
MNFQIRPFAKSDVESLRVLRNEVICNSDFIYETENWSQEIALNWYEEHTAEGRIGLTAEIEEQFLGCCYSSFFRKVSASRGIAEISIFIKKDQQRKGIALALLVEMERRLSEAGYFGMVAVIDSENLPATRLFAELAYKEIGMLERAALLRGSWRAARILHKQIPTNL